jgi:hypothetical protein
MADIFSRGGQPNEARFEFSYTVAVMCINRH